MRLFKLFNADRLPAPVKGQYKMFAIVFEGLRPPIALPPIPGHDPAQLAVTVQLSCTLCDPGVGLYGRTCSVRSGGAEVDRKGHPVPVDPNAI